VAIVNGVLRNATEVYATTVSGGATVTATGLGQIPALYAQGYTNAAGYQSVVITNKSASAHQVTIELNGEGVTGTFPIQSVSATDPSTVNTSTTEMPVTIQVSTSANPVPVPAYSVVRVDLNGGITVQTYPPGLQFTIDTQPAQAATQFLNLTPGSHTINAPSPQSGAPGTQFVFTGWSDGGAAQHTITATGEPATYTAYFKAQYQLTTAVSPAGAGAVSPASGTYYDSGSQITVSATPIAPYVFTSWSGAASGTANSTQVILNVPQSVTAGFLNADLACEGKGSGLPSVADVQAIVSQALGVQQAVNDLNGDGAVNIVDVQIEVNAALGKGCSAS
jgi:hypothetical protein